MTGKIKRRWVQFSLRTLALWGLAVGTYLAYGLPASVLLLSLVVAAGIFFYL
jgi:hypothetical protein